MKSIIFFIFIGLFTISVESHNDTQYWHVDTSSNFNKPHIPFTDALSMWVLRQNLSIDGHTTLIGSELGLGDQGLSVVGNSIELFMPLIKKRRFYSMFGTAYLKKTTLSNQAQFDKPLTSFTRFWIPIQYCANRWRYMLLYENFLRGDAESLFNKIGNTQRIFAMVSYGFNPIWQLTGFIVYFEDQMENKTNKTLLPAFQIRYNPCHNLLIAAGAPLLFGFEWSLNSKLDFYFSQVLLDKTHLFLHYNITESIGLSLVNIRLTHIHILISNWFARFY